MKKSIFFILTLSLLQSINILAQGCINDLIVKTSGDILQVSIKEVDSESVTFSYPDEELKNKLDKSQIQKIILKNGRTQVFQPSNHETLTAKGIATNTTTTSTANAIVRGNSQNSVQLEESKDLISTDYIRSKFDRLKSSTEEKFAPVIGETEKEKEKREKSLEKALKDLEKEERKEIEVVLEKNESIKLENQRIKDKNKELIKVQQMDNQKDLTKKLENIELNLENLESDIVTVLPPNFILEGEYSSSSSDKSQTFIIDFFSDKAKKFSVKPQPRRKTNAKMFKHSISGANIENISIEDLAKITNTEYFIVVEVVKDFDKFKKQSKKDIEREREKEKKFETTTRMWIYKYDGSVVYENKLDDKHIKSRMELEKEDWQNHVKFMLKKSPFYFK